MPDLEPSESPHDPLVALKPHPTATARIVALLEVLLCSDYPTQIGIGATLITFGVPPTTATGALSLTFVVALSMIDTALLLALMLLLLHAHGDDPKRLFIGARRVADEVVTGAWLSLVSFVIAVIVLTTILQVAPQLHTVADNPLQSFMRNPRDAALFAVVVVVAGGVREELQRAFLLDRFDRWLGGPVVGIVVTSILFGAGHLPQGVDATIATGLLGAFWGIVYIRRRSAIAPVVSHAGFNVLQVLQFIVLGR
jgi:membrane protease YdiL (CAAX protease family)